MRISVSEEYRMLLRKKAEMERQMLSLPLGYISKKTIKGNVQYYLQRREGTKIVGEYINSMEVDEISSKIEKRKAMTSELSDISERLTQLEQAAKLIDRDLFCSFMVYKLSSGMDLLDVQAKEQCNSFARAMNAIEGVSASKETDIEIAAWKNGEEPFLTVFENTLKRYGFPVEAE